MTSEAFERALKGSSDEELVTTIKALVGNQPARTREDLKKSLAEGTEKERRVEIFSRALRIREELKRRGAHADPGEYLPDFKKYLDALGYE
jgi:hypothetical protein